MPVKPRRRSDSTYVDLILHAQMRRSDSTYIDWIPHALMRRSDSTYADPILHARLGIVESRTEQEEQRTKQSVSSKVKK